MQLEGMWVKVALAVMVAAAGCGSDGPSMTTPPKPGTLSLSYMPTAPSVPNLQLTDMHARVESVAVYGDVSPDSRTMWSGASVDLLGGPLVYQFPQAPQGLYSRVRFTVEHLSFHGTYAGRALQADIELEDSGAAVDLRDPDGQQVGPNASATFTIAVDGNAWFQGIDLSQIPGSQIQIDNLNNVNVAEAIAEHALASFTLQPSVH